MNCCRGNVQDLFCVCKITPVSGDVFWKRSVADPGCLSRIWLFSILDPHQITQIKGFQALGNLIRVVHPEPRILTFLSIPDAGSRGQKGPGSGSAITVKTKRHSATTRIRILSGSATLLAVLSRKYFFRLRLQGAANPNYGSGQFYILTFKFPFMTK